MEFVFIYVFVIIILRGLIVDHLSNHLAYQFGYNQNVDKLCIRKYFEGYKVIRELFNIQMLVRGLLGKVFSHPVMKNAKIIINSKI